MASMLPLDIVIQIISRLPLNSIIRCKCLSKDFKNIISHPSFSTINSNYLHYLFVQESMPNFSFEIVEFHRSICYDNKIKCNPVICFKSDRHLKAPNSSRGSSSSGYQFFSMWGYCNGLFCFLKIELGLFNLFVTNPISGEVYQLPQSKNEMSIFAYGLGYCQLTNKYKVLRITTHVGVYGCRNSSDIFTIGSDQHWRIVSDVNVPYNFKSEVLTLNPQSDMVAFRSALHWIVQPVRMLNNLNIEPNWGGTRYICAFDMTTENVRALQVPPEVAADPINGHVRVLSDKICLWRHHISHHDMELWVMNEYGVQGSWVKQCIIKVSELPHFVRCANLVPMTIYMEGMMVLHDSHKFIFYDLKMKKRLSHMITKVSSFPNNACHPIPFVASFVSLKELVQR